MDELGAVAVGLGEHDSHRRELNDHPRLLIGSRGGGGGVGMALLQLLLEHCLHLRKGALVQIPTLAQRVVGQGLVLQLDVLFHQLLLGEILIGVESIVV